MFAILAQTHELDGGTMDYTAGTCRRPLIGICGRPDETGEYLIIFKDYADRVYEADGLPAGLPAHEGADACADEVAERFDGIVFTGGCDIDGASFGGRAYDDSTHHPLGETMPVRDAFEGALVHACWDRDVPCLGVCRGLQVMNVAMGGRLVRDVSEQAWSMAAHIGSHLQPEPFDTPSHDVLVEPNSELARILGCLETRVNSIHHLAISEVPQGGHVVARALDGTPEAIDFTDRTFFMGVQWHPEIMGTQPELFSAFVAAADARRRALGR